jgi:hypothetical protein
VKCRAKVTAISAEPTVAGIAVTTFEIIISPTLVFEAVAALARMRYPQLDISFSYRAPFGALAASIKDTPAITITLG